MRPSKPQSVVAVTQAATNSGTKTAPFLAFSRCGSVDYQGFRGNGNRQRFPAARGSATAATDKFIINKYQCHSYLDLLNTLCNMVQPTIDLENHRAALET